MLLTIRRASQPKAKLAVLTRVAAVALAAVGLTAVASVVSTQTVLADSSSQVTADRITLNHNQVLV